tara:strand:+ start:51 stop:542 length:492 start_codon:yes stop_codon:yes gene_type:complete
MNTLSIYQDKRAALKQKYLGENANSSSFDSAGTGGIDHLAMIASDIERTIEFYTNILGMRVSRIVQNRDEPTSTHVFLDMGGGNLLAFFDFPELGKDPTTRGIGAMHHVALKGTTEQYNAVIHNLKSNDIAFSIHDDEDASSVYFRDPDNILLEVRTRHRDGQ